MGATRKKARPRRVKAAEPVASLATLWERLLALAHEVPDEELVGRPTDVAEQHDHYIYGTPKRR